MQRRHFLQVVGAGAGALILGLAPASRGGSRRRADPFVPNAFVRVNADGTVTVTVARAEMGQGSRTALALLVAEELDADWARVRVVQGDLDSRYGDQFAGGSAVVRTSWEPLRQAGAVARAMLLAAAAARWNVAAGECHTADGAVHHATRGRLLYGDLVEDAARLPVPAEVRLKPREEFRLIGQGRPNLDHPQIVAGRMAFGSDTRLPGMLYAVVERAPVFGAAVRRVDETKARAVRGVRAVVSIDADRIPEFGENNPRPANGVAVIADSTWAALRGRQALMIEWDERGGREEGTAAMRAACEQLAGGQDRWVTARGEAIDTGLQRAARRVEATYEVPLLAHAPMEPMNCTAWLRDGRCEVWAPTQNPEYVGVAAQQITGLAPAQITVHVTRMGGAFGRRFYADYAAEAIYLARASGAPVQVLWTREDDLGHDLYRPAGYHRLRAGVDQSGAIVAWEHRLWNASRGHYLGWTPPPGRELNPGELSPDDYPVVLGPAFRYAYTPLSSRIPRGQWRAVENSANVFVIQGFLDELAHAAQLDPLAFQLAVLDRNRELLVRDSRYDAGRLAAVLRAAAERAGWSRPLPAGSGRGIAGCFANNSYVAEVVEVTVSPSRDVHVQRVVAVVDCGQVVNPGGARAQVEGSVLQGLSAAFREEITVTAGRVDQRNFDQYPLLRLAEAPPIDVHFIVSAGAPGGLGGLGEPALPPVAPALANAIFAASGQRVRRLPLSTSGFRPS